MLELLFLTAHSTKKIIMKSKQKGFLQQALPPGSCSSSITCTCSGTGTGNGRANIRIQKGITTFLMITWLMILVLLIQLRVDAQSTKQLQNQKQITGTVLTEAHTPVIGATVTVLTTK